MSQNPKATMATSPAPVTTMASEVRSSRLYQNERLSHTPVSTLAPSTTGRMKIPSRKLRPTISANTSRNSAMPRKISIEAMT